MEFLLDYGLFLAKILTFAVTVIAVLLIVKSAGGKQDQKGKLEIINLTDKHRDLIHVMESHLYDEITLKAFDKEEKKSKKSKEKETKNKLKRHVEIEVLESNRKPHLFVIDFKGSIDAREVMSLREEITAILAVAKDGDEVMLRLESGGGMVHAYGLASSQLNRIKQAKILLTVSVDKVAASGGYMMACVADKIIAAPFAVVGSIGVIAQFPNFNKLLKKHNVEFEQLTAGEFKRTLTMFGENTDKAREKFVSELDETHILFKNFIVNHRPLLNLEKVSTGEHWFGNQALPLGLIDCIGTSDDYLVSAVKERDVLGVRYVQRRKLSEKLAGSVAEATDRLLLKWILRGQRPIV
ncbi:protease SohB [Candidatus Enterovibrio escicola]|uniref:Putative protease sohB n=2 Tax=Candidatus Enterovibrio escicola TaxID=1927127 RepID=A0A2A5T439_9GAMM|nr:protease SohB [Candidatus Enterovibrio escacola]PCS22911.1 putative protease sohB [Candidatus Enterovibrio escacola]